MAVCPCPHCRQQINLPSTANPGEWYRCSLCQQKFLYNPPTPQLTTPPVRNLSTLPCPYCKSDLLHPAMSDAGRTFSCPFCRNRFKYTGLAAAPIALQPVPAAPTMGSDSIGTPFTTIFVMWGSHTLAFIFTTIHSLSAATGSLEQDPFLLILGLILGVISLGLAIYLACLRNAAAQVNGWIVIVINILSFGVAFVNGYMRARFGYT